MGTTEAARGRATHQGWACSQEGGSPEGPHVQHPRARPRRQSIVPCSGASSEPVSCHPSRQVQGLQQAALIRFMLACFCIGLRSLPSQH